MGIGEIEEGGGQKGNVPHLRGKSGRGVGVQKQ